MSLPVMSLVARQQDCCGTAPRRGSSRFTEERGRPPHAQLYLTSRTAESADPGELVLNPLIGETDVLVKASG
ncbi:MAG: hypothetical protein E6I47_16390 [Chloroflexi bacterium]|nr:MAG: hypothetical protein E6I47_16390 [Chloroflexota bacterium]